MVHEKSFTKKAEEVDLLFEILQIEEIAQGYIYFFKDNN
jgi:hypothetical protein